ncbi:two-component system sensor kinase FixL [Pontibacter ummariensis]|uniref:Sensor protein FixL n=1 Tax=Pontibacter ummariensis TaxID=1610492 RepID=A0A239FH62_9BACT|nr:PAS domain-containing sensor histidine kinase [Pontibacter ummariensis]PRY12261.1 two-component system sensor kinase FixL [Pontibacter ummariensis]SNS56095.1 two-component system, LuxR family, sensor kinase FixL [Pontibacter ummariensis]
MEETHHNQNNSTDSQTRLKAIIDTAIDGIITIDRHGVIETMNPAAARIFGYEPEECIGQNVSILMPEPDRSLHDKYIENYHRTGVGQIIGKGREVLGKKKDGTVFPFRLSISEVNLQDKQLFTGIVHDITELKKAEAALRESESKINSIIQTAVDGIITIDKRGIMEMVNASAARLFGYTEEELLGKKINILMPEPDRSLHDNYMHHYHETGERRIIGIGREVSGLKKDGTIFPLYLSISEVHLAERTVYTGFIHDITQQKISEERLRRYAAELERSNRELQDFAYVSSHDLQEPLRKIQAFGDRVKTKEYDNLSEQGKDYVDRMLNAAVRMQNLINDLLSFSRVTTKSKPFVPVDLDHILTEVLSDLEVTIEQTGAVIERSPLPTIEAEPTQMRQLFQNLISNAIKFRKDDVKPIIRIFANKLQRQAHMTATPGDELVEITVEDNGIGFDEKYLDRIFNIFQRLEGQKYEGSGVGLAICRKIAVRHGGDITARSQPGVGTRFIVLLAMKHIQE